MRVCVVGFPFTEIRGRPLETLLGGRVRSWALFDSLPKYGFDTRLYVDPPAEVSDEINELYGSRFVRTQTQMLAQTEAGEFDAVIICGTRIQEVLKHQAWLENLRNTKILAACCYDNNPELPSAPFMQQLIGMAVNTPLQKRLWEERGTNVPSFLMTSGQPARAPNAPDSDGSAVFMGYIHGGRYLLRLAEIARHDPERDYHVVSANIRATTNEPHTSMGTVPADERDATFTKLVEQVADTRPPNLHYHFMPPGEETELLDRATIGLDFNWHTAGNIENTKVCNYLAFGLAPVVERPAPSYRFVYRFGAGAVLGKNRPPAEWVEAIAVAAQHSTEDKNRLRTEASEFFSWENVALEVGSFLLDALEMH